MVELNPHEIKLTHSIWILKRYIGLNNHEWIEFMWDQTSTIELNIEKIGSIKWSWPNLIHMRLNEFGQVKSQKDRLERWPRPNWIRVRLNERGLVESRKDRSDKMTLVEFNPCEIKRAWSNRFFKTLVGLNDHG